MNTKEDTSDEMRQLPAVAGGWERVTYPQLPLSIYRELGAHLQQVPGVIVQLVPQESPQFDYLQSQVGGLLIEYVRELDSRDRQQVEAILNYYGEIYGSCARQPHLETKITPQQGIA